jgi:UDPglucose 6-dehydrogenase
MNICVVGTGYVGLVTGAVFADLGNDVVCVDKVRGKIDGRLTFTTDLPAAVRQSDVVFIAVGTPPRESGETDLSHVEAVAAEIGKTMDRYKVIVNKSTVPVGTGELVREVITRHQARPIEFDVVSNPEFLREGSAIEDTLRPDRIVIGASNQGAAMKLVELYAPLERPMIITDLPSAEVIKYASNAFLAAKISFINAIANVCESAGADVTQVMKGMGMDGRIGGAFLQAGLGYGGSCFPKDVDSLIHTAGRFGYDFKLLKAVVDINRERSGRLVEVIRKVLGPLEVMTVAVLGLAFKPNTDDMREAKSIDVVHQLTAAGATVRAYDPVAAENARTLLPDCVVYAASPYEAAQDADAVVLITEWNEFKYLNLERLRGVLRRRIIFDGRNVWEPERMRRLGFEYYSIGRKPVVPA